jgi:hypothetical protein
MINQFTLIGKANIIKDVVSVEDATRGEIIPLEFAEGLESVRDSLYPNDTICVKGYIAFDSTIKLVVERLVIVNHVLGV